MAYAPLRELILPPPDPITLALLYSTEKEAWLDETLQEFQASNPTVNGHPVRVETQKMGSREIYLEVLDGQIQPDIISPASSLQIAILEDLSAGKWGRSLVDPADHSLCRSPFKTPLVFAAWSDRANVLWGDHPNGDFWNKLQSALTYPEGWAGYNHPEWGYIKFGHTDPTKSNSGFMTLVLMTYGYFSKSSGLNAEDVLSNQDFQVWLKDFEGTISEFGDSTGTYMRDIVAYGPSKYDIVAVYEATAIEQIENARGRYGELLIYYPPVTIMSDHPFCVIDAEWVTPEKREASRLLLDFLTSKPAQERALLGYGFRPQDPTISIDQPNSPFVRYAQNGLRLDLPPEAEIPDGNVLETLLTFWIRNIQK
jgi:ABC-type Fe3+ transport system substrate-binding protein